MINSEINQTEPKPFRNMTQPVFWQICVLLVILIVVFSSAIVNELKNIAAEKEQKTFTTDNTKKNNATAISAALTDPFTEVSLQADSVIVWDVVNQTALFSQNESDTLPLASITKLMTALLAHELLAEKTSVAISYNDILQSGDSGLMAGERFSLENLNDLVLVTSSNDGASALAATGGSLLGSSGAADFVTAMNIRAEQLDLDSMSFLNPTGLDISSSEASAVGSAADVAKLMEYILINYPDILQATTQKNEYVYNQSGAYHVTQNTNGTVDQIEGLLGSKTGYTDLSGGNLVIAFEAGLNRPIIITVLGSSRNGRFTDVLQLVEAARKQLIQ